MPSAPTASQNMNIISTVDVVLLTLTGPKEDRQLAVALLIRDKAPFEGLPALPGGYIHAQEDKDTQDAAERTLKAKTGIQSPYLEQLGVWSGPSRDPRGWSLSVVYFALVPEEVITAAGHKDVQLVSVDRLKGLPFDHKDIVESAVQRVRNKSAYSTLAAHFCGEDFTLGELQGVYEAVLGEPVNKVSFRSRMKEMDAFEDVPGVKRSDGGRPAQVYRLKKAYRRSLSVLDRGLGWQS